MENAPAGTRDFLPKDMRTRNWLFDIWRDVSISSGFQEYDCPIVEYQNLYTRKGGDDILQEMFTMEIGNNKLALRPEMTPSVCRLIMNNYTTETPPFKWFSIPQCWRYEDIKRGRKREHYQWNVDIFGATAIKSEIEILMMICAFFEQINLTPADVVVKISNRMILQKVIQNMGIDNALFEPACIIIDKLAKMSVENMTIKLKNEIGMTDQQVMQIYDLCAIKDIKLIANYLGENDPTFSEMSEIFSLAEKIGISQWLQFDASIVRGLSYYSGMVFEAFSKSLPNLQKSICGGGRYDDLLTKYGYREKVPAIGFGFGDVVITELLSDLGKLPVLTIATKFLIVPFDELFADACNVAQQMRLAGANVEIYTKNTNMSKAFDYAYNKNIKFVVLIAPNEWSKREIKIKNMWLEKDDPLKQQTILLDDFITRL